MNKDVKFMVWIPAELKRRLKIYCEETDKTMSKLVRRLIEEHLDKEGK